MRAVAIAWMLLGLLGLQVHTFVPHHHHETGTTHHHQDDVRDESVALSDAHDGPCESDFAPHNDSPEVSRITKVFLKQFVAAVPDSGFWVDFGLLHGVHPATSRAWSAVQSAKHFRHGPRGPPLSR